MKTTLLCDDHTVWTVNWWMLRNSAKRCSEWLRVAKLAMMIPQWLRWCGPCSGSPAKPSERALLLAPSSASAVWFIDQLYIIELRVRVHQVRRRYPERRCVCCGGSLFSRFSISDTAGNCTEPAASSVFYVVSCSAED